MLRRSLNILIAAYAITLFSPTTFANVTGDTFTWTGLGGDSNWSTAANWDANVSPPSDGSANIVIDDFTFIDSPWSINSMTLSNSTGNSAPLIDGAELTIGAGGLTTDNNGSNQFITRLVSAPIRLAADQAWSGDGFLLPTSSVDTNGFNLELSIPRFGGGLTSGGLVGTGSLTTVGSDVALNGDNAHTGGSFLRANRTTLQGGNSLGAVSSPVVIDNATLQIQEELAIANPISITGDASQLTIFANPARLTGPIGGSGALRLFGSGDLILEGPNTHSGLVTVEDGISLIGTASTLPSRVHLNRWGLLAFRQDTDAEYAGEISGDSLIEKDGSGTLRLTGSNTFSGFIEIFRGVVEVDAGSQGIPEEAGIVFRAQDDLGIVQYVGDHTYTGEFGFERNVYWNLDGGFSARDGKLTLNFFGDGREIDWRLGELILGSPTANNVTEWVNPIHVEGRLRVRVNEGTGNDEAVMSGVIRGDSGISKSGPGVLRLTANNESGRETRIWEGALQANDGQGLPTSSVLQMSGPGNGVLMGDGPTTFTRDLGTDPGDIQWIGSSGGFAASGGKMTVTIGNNRTLTWNQGAFLPQEGTLVLGYSRADSEVELTNPLSLGFFENKIHVPAGLGGDFARLSGNITGIGSFNKTGDGTLVVHSLNPGQGVVVEEGTLINADRVFRTTTVEGNAKIGGDGLYAGLVLNPGSTIAPGNSIGILRSFGTTWREGATLEVEIENATGTSGVDWDLWSGGARSTINLSDSPDPSAAYRIKLISLNQGLPGALDDFDPSQEYMWQIVAGFSNINSSPGTQFALDLSEFGNDLRNGTFEVLRSGGSLSIRFTPIPEPSTLVLAAVSLALLLRWRQRDNPDC